jgi:hypothetical protein
MVVVTAMHAVEGMLGAFSFWYQKKQSAVIIPININVQSQ